MKFEEVHTFDTLMATRDAYNKALDYLSTYIEAWFHANRDNTVMYADYRDCNSSLSISHYDSENAYIRASYWYDDEAYEMPLAFAYSSAFREAQELRCVDALEKLELEKQKQASKNEIQYQRNIRYQQYLELKAEFE